MVKMMSIAFKGLYSSLDIQLNRNWGDTLVFSGGLYYNRIACTRSVNLICFCFECFLIFNFCSLVCNL